MSTTPREALAEWKHLDMLDPEEHPETQNHGIVVLLDQDPILAQLVAAWHNVPIGVDPNPNEPMPPDIPEYKLLRWVWARITPDPIPTWLETAGLPERPDFIRKCWSAIDNRMVFPDGTRSRWAQQFVTRRVREAL